VVHRLDKDTSGIMLFAKNEKMKATLQENWKEIVTERMYTALVEGNVKKQSGTITSWLTESKTFKMYSSSFDNGGKQAITHYKKIRGNKNYSLLEVMLETGRKNQIRVHMEEIGHPIVGDKKYGAHGNPLKRVGLHATTLVFKHPVTGKQMKFTSKVPKKFNKLLKEN
jgi:23S rRNA pseudouridine1911/1915/1917 synthase